MNAEKAAWQSVLETEVRRWSAVPLEEMTTRLPELAVYEAQFQEKKYQVEVELLQDIEKQLLIMISVDDGVLPRALRPLTQIISREKFPSP